MKEEHPIWPTTTSEFGKLPAQFGDLPMRWYGLTGGLPQGHGETGAAEQGRTGLNTALDRSKFYEYDQGWRGNLSITDFNIANKVQHLRDEGPQRTHRLTGGWGGGGATLVIDSG